MLELNTSSICPLVSRRSKFFSSLDDTLGILSKIEDLREAVDEAEEEEEEEEEAEGGDMREAEEDVEEEEEDEDEDFEPRVSLIGSRMFLDRSDNVPEPEEALGSLTRYTCSKSYQLKWGNF